MMRNAAHRQDDEAPPEPPARDLTAEAGALLDHARALLPVLKARGDTRAVDEMVVLGIQLGDLTAALEDSMADESVVEAVDRAAYARGWADRDAAGQQSSRPRHAGGRSHLRALPSIPATAARTAAAGIVAAGLTGGIVAHIHDASAVRAIAASPARHGALHPMAPDQAVAVPRFSPRPRFSPSPGPSAAAASARPVPVVTPRLPAPSVPPPTVSPAPVTAAPSAPVPPALVVSGLVDLGDSIAGQLRLSATGPEAVEWTATATDGIRLSQYAGVAVRGQDVALTITDPAGGTGWVYVSFGGTTIPVEVTSALGTPALALPSGL